MRTLALASTVLSLWAAPFARAQVEPTVDPSAALLLNGANPAPADGAVESGRYMPRPRPTPEAGRRRALAPSSASRSNERASKRPPADPAIEASAPQAEAPAAGSQARGAPSPEPRAGSAPEPAGSSGAPLVEVSSRSRPASAELPRARADEFGEIEGVGAKPVSLGDQEDRRYNLIELDIAPLFVYSDSASSYVHRRYSTSGTGLGASARVWFSPSFGAQAGYSSTFAGHVTDALSTSQRNVSADHEWLRIGVRGRKHFGSGARAPSLTLGLDYSEYQFSVSNEAALRQKLRTFGLTVVLAGDWPSSPNYAWTFRLAATPRARHEEISTQNGARSGANPETNVLEAGIGGRLEFDRSNEVFWRLSHRIDQTLYSGSATSPDFQTGAIPTNVSVANSFTVFELGYAWGN